MKLQKAILVSLGAALTVFLFTILASANEVWQPTPGTSWQWQLTGEIDTSFAVQMYDIDLFDVLGQVTKLLAYFDWALNEQCFRFNECDLLLPFVEVGKAVFGTVAVSVH